MIDDTRELQIMCSCFYFIAKPKWEANEKEKQKKQQQLIGDSKKCADEI